MKKLLQLGLLIALSGLYVSGLYVSAQVTITGSTVVTGTGGGGSSCSDCALLPAANVFTQLNTFPAVNVTGLLNGTTLYEDSSSNLSLGNSSITPGGAGAQNTALGDFTMTGVTGSNNNALGANALNSLMTGSTNLAVGTQALQSLVSGSGNVAVGGLALSDITTQSGNTALGTEAGSGSSAPGQFPNLSNGVYIGFQAAPAAAGTYTNQIVIGAGATGSASNQTTLGNSSTTSAVIFGVPTFPQLGGSGAGCMGVSNSGLTSLVSCGGGGSGTVNPALQYSLPIYVNSGTASVVGGALKFEELPNTLTPAQRSAAINTFSYYSGQIILGDLGASTPANPYSHAPFANDLGVGILGDRMDVPKFPSNVKDYGGQCDAGVQNVSTIMGTNQVTLTQPNGSNLANAVVAGMSIGVVGTVSGVPTAWEPIIVSVSGSTVTTFDNAPFTVTSAPAVYGHDDTAYIQSVLNKSVGLPGGVYGKPTLPGGACLVHTLIMSNGPSLQGQGTASSLIGFPGEDVIALSDPNNPPAGIGYFGQGLIVQQNDFAIQVNPYIDATLAWKQVVTLPSVPTGSCIEGNFSGCSATTNTFAADSLNRHWGRTSPWANDPVGPGWCTGDDQADGGLCVASVGSVTNGSTTLCVPTNPGAMPTNSDTIVFPYLTPAFKTTIGSPTTCSGGTQYTMGAPYPGPTSPQQEFMSGVAFQSLNASISSSATSLVGNLTVHPQWFAISNVGSHGLLQIDSEQISYRVLVNESNTFLNLTRGVNGTTAASHATNALMVPLNPVVPSRPWPVTPSLTIGIAATPPGAEYYPAGGVGNAAYAMPLLSGSDVAYAGLSDGSYLHNINLETVNGVSDNTNNTAGFWVSQLPYSVQFDRIFITGTDFGWVMGPPTNDYEYMVQQSSCNATTWNKFTIRSNHGWYNLCGGQTTQTNIDIYNTLGVLGWAQWAEQNDQGSGQSLFGGGDNLANVYNECNGGCQEGVSEGQDAFEASNDTISNTQWVTGNIFMFVGQGNQGQNVNFPNGNVNAPLIFYGQGNVLRDTDGVGPPTVNSNVYGAGSVLNFGHYGGNNVDGIGVGGIPYNVSLVGPGSRAVAGLQSGESLLLGNVLPSNQVLDLNAGLIYPGEIETKMPTKYPNSMDGIVTDFAAPFNAAVYCKGSSGSCQPQYFVPCAFSCGLQIAQGSRIIPGTYTVYIPYRTNTGTPTSTIALQVWNGGTATTVATSSVTNSTSWQTLEFDNVNLGAYSGYTIGLLVNTFSSSSANYYIGGIEMSPLPQKFQVYNLVVNGTCTGCGGGSGTFQVNGTGLASSSTVNFENGSNITVTNPSAGNIQFAVTGNVPTASALNAAPTLCGTGSSPTGILANGNATGCQAVGGGGGGGPTLQTNGVNNSSQTLLNHLNTASVLWTNPSGGVVSATVPTATTSVLGISEPDNVSLAVTAGVLSIKSPGANTVLGFNGSTFAGFTAGVNISLASGQITNTSSANTVSATLTSGTFPVATATNTIGNSTLSQAAGALSWAPGSGSTIIGSGTASNVDGWGELTFAGSSSQSYTFVNTYTVHPECQATPQFNVGSGTVWVTYTGTTAFTINLPAPGSGAVSYHCDERD